MEGLGKNDVSSSCSSRCGDDPRGSGSPGCGGIRLDVAELNSSRVTKVDRPTLTVTCITDLQAGDVTTSSHTSSTDWMRTKTCRLSSMLVLTFGFFLVEIIFGYVTNSLALISDSYHMLSDVIALCIGIACVRISKLESGKNTYGWARAEVLGALVNSVFLIALCFTIFVEAIQRLTQTDDIEHVDWMLYVGIAGLVINVIGLLLFHGDTHGHSHGGGGGGHGHGHHKHHGHDVEEEDGSDNDVAVARGDADGNGIVTSGSLAVISPGKSGCDDDQLRSESSDIQGQNERNSTAVVDLEKPEKKKKNTAHSSAQLNMRGVFLHVLGDALGSVVVIVSALVIKFTTVEWRFKVDPAMSLVMVLIILSTTIPLLRESAMILMQTVPTHIQASELKKKLVSTVDGVLAVHEFHVWQLAGSRIVASAHILCVNAADYMHIAERVKSFFHDEGIHSTTIQPEFVQYEEEVSSDRDCVLECGPDKSCYADTCCARKKSPAGLTQQHGLQDPTNPLHGLRQRNASVVGSEMTPGIYKRQDGCGNTVLADSQTEINEWQLRQGSGGDLSRETRL